MYRPLLVLLGAAACLAETHRFTPAQYYNTFSFAHKPALRIRPGDRVITQTIDSRGGDVHGNTAGERGNPQTGPFYVEGAEPGDTLIVKIEKIEPNRDTAFSSSVLAPYTADPAFLRAEGLRQQTTEVWKIDRARRVAVLENEAIKPRRIEVPFRPMLGCVATAPDRKQAVPTSTPDNFGGNMDYHGMNAGITLMLPVFEPGALLFIGDGHVRQGEGEVLGNALETSMDVEFTVELAKGKRIGWPRFETADHIGVLGSARPLLQAVQHATTELQRWLMAEHGFDERGSSLLMGHALEYEIANIVDPHFTVVARIRKSYLGQ
ncbi:MAG: acetamidase/formamidase family protein [Bryobacteraceae bacterium]